eukprot:14567803-Alexandrium_andersonii.AAC.1
MSASLVGSEMCIIDSLRRVFGDERPEDRDEALGDAAQSLENKQGVRPSGDEAISKDVSARSASAACSDAEK